MKIILKIFNSVGITMFLWLVLSYIEIITKNVNPNPVYSCLNFFNLFYK